MLKVEESSGGPWAPTLCESCRSAPCTVFCRADAAALCAACDANIHSANLLARRHHRVPILPVTSGGGAAGLVVRPSLNLPYHVGVPVDGERGGGVGDEEDQEQEDDDEAAASWMLLNPLKGSNIQSCRSLLFGDEFLDLEDYNSNNANTNNSSENQSAEDFDVRKDQDARRRHGGRSEAGSEFLVPNEHNSQQQHHQHEHQQGYHNMMDQFEGSHGFSYSFSLNHSASFSSMDASLMVPDATCMSDISNADQYVLPSKGTVDLFSGHPFLQVPSQFNPMDREARVLRYREKRKNRKFEKTIRYASRKAYAETRPRIKGRFAKRSDLEVEVDQMFSTSALADSSYGIVPSF